MPELFDVLLGVPIDSSGSFAGCERLPAALRAAGIVEAAGATDLGNLQVTIADPERDESTGVVGVQDVLESNRVIESQMRTLFRAGHRPLVLGGCCSLLLGLGSALASEHPKAGLLFVDGHLDCYDGASSASGEFADMELACLLGEGAQSLVNFSGRTPTLPDDGVVVLGVADELEALERGAPDPRSFAPAMRIVSIGQLQADIAGAADEALSTFDDRGFWLHLDLDVLSQEHLPAVDYPQPEGLSWEELENLLQRVFAHPGLIGASLAILNPTLDTDGIYAGRTVEMLRASLKRAAGGD